MVASMSHTSPLLKHDGSTISIVFQCFSYRYLMNLHLKQEKPPQSHPGFRCLPQTARLLDVFETRLCRNHAPSSLFQFVPRFSHRFPKKQLAIPWGHARKARRGRRHSPPRSERRRSMAATCTAAQAPVG